MEERSCKDEFGKCGRSGEKDFGSPETSKNKDIGG